MNSAMQEQTMRLQSLPRFWARRCLAIEAFCLDSLGVDLRGTRLVVAYSTGLDSAALLHLLHILAPRTGFSLIAAHAHHGLRPESDAELPHARKVCAELGIPCETARLDVRGHQAASGRGTEESARLLRYEFLESVRARYDADWIVTAHHADDLAEDMVLRRVRGTGWPGLGGMPGVDSKRRLLRPVLDWTKEDLHAFALACGLAWHEDRSNQSTDPTRNRIRRQVMPLLRRENPSLSRSVLNLWRLARLDEDFWNTELTRERDSRILTHRTLATCHPAKRLRLYKAVLDGLGPGQALSGHLFLLDRAWADKKTGTIIQFPGDKTARITPSGILFERQ